MTRSARISLSWADGDYDFRLDIARLEAVQEACDAGPAELLTRLAGNRWRVADIRQPILHGLIGAGQSTERARALVHTWVGEGQLQENILTAQAVLMAAVMGAPEDDDDEAEDTSPGEPPPADPQPCPVAS